ncbi:hypothetical protein B0G82_7868 [Paraburkholderia sp. BL17N1]|nr:hypothetical protein B0G82_7868 [Paraburkholderia sp. BL17N1]
MLSAKQAVSIPHWVAYGLAKPDSWPRDVIKVKFGLLATQMVAHKGCSTHAIQF